MPRWWVPVHRRELVTGNAGCSGLPHTASAATTHKKAAKGEDETTALLQYSTFHHLPFSPLASDLKAYDFLVAEVLRVAQDAAAAVDNL